MILWSDQLPSPRRRSVARTKATRTSPTTWRVASHQQGFLAGTTHQMVHQQGPRQLRRRRQPTNSLRRPILGVGGAGQRHRATIRAKRGCHALPLQVWDQALGLQSPPWARCSARGKVPRGWDSLRQTRSRAVPERQMRRMRTRRVATMLVQMLHNQQRLRLQQPRLRCSPWRQGGCRHHFHLHPGHAERAALQQPQQVAAQEWARRLKWLCTYLHQIL